MNERAAWKTFPSSKTFPSQEDFSVSTDRLKERTKGTPLDSWIRMVIQCQVWVLLLKLTPEVTRQTSHRGIPFHTSEHQGLSGNQEGGLAFPPPPNRSTFSSLSLLTGLMQERTIRVPSRYHSLRLLKGKNITAICNVFRLGGLISLPGP